MQAKLLEKALSGYQVKSDGPQTKKQSLFDSWSKITYPGSLVPETIEPDVSASALDGVLFIQASQEESERRSKNRKIDP